MRNQIQTTLFLVCLVASQILIINSQVQPAQPATPQQSPDDALVRYVRVVKDQGQSCLTIAQIQVFNLQGQEIAQGKPATASSNNPLNGGSPAKANDGNASVKHFGEIFHQDQGQNDVLCSDPQQYWLVDLEVDQDVNKVVYYNRLDCCQERSIGNRVQLENAQNQAINYQRLKGGNNETLYFYSRSNGGTLACQQLSDLKTKLEKKIQSASSVSITDIQAQIDQYKQARDYSKQALDIMSPVAQNFIQKKQRQTNIQSQADSQINIFAQIKQINIDCKKYSNFESKQFNQLCDKLINFMQIQDQETQQDFCSLANTSQAELSKRSIAQGYDKQLVCQDIYIIELLQALIEQYQQILNGGRKQEILAALDKIVKALNSAQCQLCDYVLLPNSFEYVQRC